MKSVNDLSFDASPPMRRGIDSTRFIRQREYFRQMPVDEDNSDRR